LPQGGPDSERSSSASETPFAGVSCGSTGRKSRACRTSTTLTGENGQGQLFSPEAFPANRSALADGGAEPPTSVRSGLKCAESLTRRGPLGLFAKTCLVSSGWASSKCFLTWTRMVTKRNLSLFRLVPQAQTTDATGCGLLPTPQAAYTAPNKNANARCWGPDKTLWHMAKNGTWPDGCQDRGTLSVEYVEHLMGYPKGWTDA